MENKALFSNTVKIRIDDINYGNHLCHAKLISHIHNTRALFLKSNGLTEINCFGSGLIMLSLNIDYLCECFFDDELEINMYLKNLEKARIEFVYSATNITSKNKIAQATTVMSFFDYDKRKIKRIPEEFKKLINSLI